MNNCEIAGRIARVVLWHITEVRGAGGRSTAGLTDAIKRELEAIEQEGCVPVFPPWPQPSSVLPQQEPGIDY